MREVLSWVVSESLNVVLAVLLGLFIPTGRRVIQAVTNPIDPSYPDPNPERPGLALLAVSPAGR